MKRTGLEAVVFEMKMPIVPFVVGGEATTWVLLRAVAEKGRKMYVMAASGRIQYDYKKYILQSTNHE